MGDEIRIKAAEMALDLTKALLVDKNGGHFLGARAAALWEGLGTAESSDISLVLSHLHHQFMMLMSGPDQRPGAANSGAGD